MARSTVSAIGTGPMGKGATYLTDQVIGFIGHLRLNRFPVGPAEAECVLQMLDGTSTDMNRARAGMKSILASRRDEWDRFDDLFEAYWAQRGRERRRSAPQQASQSRTTPKLPRAWKNHFSDENAIQLSEAPQIESEGESNFDGEASGRLIASDRHNQFRTDFHQLAEPDEIREAENLAYRLACAIRNRLSRRAKAAHAGRRIDLRRTIRNSLSKGGEPLQIARKKRPKRPVRIIIFLDVSGSMKAYSRFFLQFLKGLLCTWVDADAFLIHTRLVRITDALKDNDPARAMARLSLMANGFGGGTKLGESLQTFNDRYAARSLNSRSVVLIMSDGYDTGPAEDLSRELHRISKRARRIIWLNPLLGWQNYQPLTAAMQAARPHIDLFAAANTPETMAAIEPHIGRL